MKPLAADPTLWTAPDDPRLTPVRDACRAAGTAAVVNCASRGRLTSYVYGPDGELLTRYAKQHLHTGEDEVFRAGAEDGRFELDGFRFALATYLDNHFPKLAERASADNCTACLASSLYGRGNGEHEIATVYPALAKDFGLHVAVANHVGQAGPYDACGHSAVWGPDGMLLAQADARGASHWPTYRLLTGVDRFAVIAPPDGRVRTRSRKPSTGPGTSSPRPTSIRAYCGANTPLGQAH